MTREEYLRQQLEKTYQSYLEHWDKWDSKGYAMRHGKPHTKDEFVKEYRKAIDAGQRNIARDMAASQKEVSYHQSQNIYIEYREAAKQLQKEIDKLESKSKDGSLSEKQRNRFKEEKAELKKKQEQLEEKRARYSTRTAALQAGDAKTTFSDLAQLVGYKEAEEFYYPEKAARRSRHAESRLIKMEFF